MKDNAKQIAPAPANSGPGEGPKQFRATSSDGLTLAGETLGQPGAPEILFVHGLRQSRLCWDNQFNAPELAGFRCVRFDLRGHGDSDKPEDPTRYSDLDLWADDVAAVIAAARLTRPVIVGWSKGGYVVGGYLRRFGDADVAGINLVDAYTTLVPEYFSQTAFSLFAAGASHDLSTRVAATVEFLLACFHQPPGEDHLQRLMVINGMTPRAVSEDVSSAPPPDLLAVFRHFKRPLLLSHGAHDQLVRLDMAQAIHAQAESSTLSVYENSGHSPFWEEPGRFNKELAAFADEAWKR